MESFYGGRTGASFTFSHTFDGIDIEDNSKFTYDYYASNQDGTVKYWDSKDNLGANEYVELVDTSGRIIYLVKQIPENRLRYSWKRHSNDGSPLSVIAGYYYPKIYAKGMLQHESEIKYGEYILIDTITHLQDKTNQDNGKVYYKDFDGLKYLGSISMNDLTSESILEKYLGLEGKTTEWQDTDCFRTKKEFYELDLSPDEQEYYIVDSYIYADENENPSNYYFINKTLFTNSTTSKFNTDAFLAEDNRVYSFEDDDTLLIDAAAVQGITTGIIRRDVLQYKNLSGDITDLAEKITTLELDGDIRVIKENISQFES